ncbi:MAG: prepilin-type N-terminal cleavage/methylation domain-containing protein [Planctomycetota bacterium]
MPARPGTISDPSRFRCGFSLIELVVVIAVVAVLAAIAVPRFANASAAYRLDLSTNRAVTDIAIVAVSAAAAGAPRTIEYTTAKDIYSMPGLERTSGTGTPWVQLGSSPYDTDLVRAQFSGSLPVLTFDGQGTVSSPGFIVLAVGREARRIILTQGSSGAVVESLELASPPVADVMPPITRVQGVTSIDLLSASPSASYGSSRTSTEPVTR